MGWINLWDFLTIGKLPPINIDTQNASESQMHYAKRKKFRLKSLCEKMWYIYTMEYYSAKRNEIGSFIETWMDLESVIQSESQKEKNRYRMLTHIHGI